MNRVRATTQMTMMPRRHPTAALPKDGSDAETLRIQGKRERGSILTFEKQNMWDPYISTQLHPYPQTMETSAY